MIPGRATLAALVAALFVAPAVALPPGEPGDAAPVAEEADPYAGTVTARLLANVEAVAPGTSFHVAIEIDMAPGWHTYWENGGDAGLPTSVEWSLPPGFVAGPLLFPVPSRYEESGDLVTFGYADRVRLLTEITAPSTAPVGQRAEIKGAVSWLQCKDLCIPGGAEVSVRLPVEAESRPAAAPTLAAFTSAQAELPQPAATLERVALHAFQSHDAIPPGGDGHVAVVFEGLVDFADAKSEFFPRPSEHLWLRDATFRTDGRHLALVVPVHVDSAAPAGATLSVPVVVRIARTDGGDPWRLAFDIPLTTAPVGAVPVATNAPVFAPAPERFLAEGTEVAAALAAADAADVQATAPPPTSLARFLLLAFLGGIILNVMPCVLPVLALKVLGFVSKAEEHRSKVAKLGFVFGAGVVVSFLVLAGAVIVLQAAGEHLGWGFQFQNPIFVAILATVVFVFSLSLLGVFEIGGIAAILGLGFAAAERKDYADAFFHGVLTTVLATPCTAPMLGAAVAFAFVQPPHVILMIFLAVAFGLASPYVLLSLNPGWLRYVPKPGLWMDRFKQAMGFLLLATAVWLLAVLGAHLGVGGLTRFVGFLLVVGFFCWVHGSFLNLLSTRRRVTVVWALTLVGLGVAYSQLVHGPLAADPVLHASGGAPKPLEITSGGITWQPYSPELLDSSVREGRTVFLDLTADWCWTCKVNERTVLADGDVEAAFLRNDVLTLKGDWTRKDPRITEILQRHQRAGVPFYAVYPGGRPDETIVLPEIINKKLVLESLEKAGPSRAGA